MIYKGKKYEVMNARDTSNPDSTCPQCVFNNNENACKVSCNSHICDGAGDFLVKSIVPKHPRRILNITKDVK